MLIVKGNDARAASPGARLRSEAWTGSETVAGLLHRASLRAGGAPVEPGRPLVGICNSWSELVHCNVHLRGLAASVRKGILEAGGIPVEFPTSSLSENLMKPTTMLYRNLMAMDVEESIRAHPLDAVVLLGGCDKTLPAQMMGAASAAVPAIVLSGGPSDPARFQGKDLGVGSDLWHYTDEVRAGRMSMAEYRELEAALIPSQGHCNEMGTASTMAAVAEGLGLALSGTAALPATSPARVEAAVATGRRAVEIAHEGLLPADVLTKEAFENAIALLMALGGSTNAVVHLLALAGRVGVPLALEDFDRISARTPVLANLQPSGEFLMDRFARAGGVPAVLHELRPILALGAKTIDGRTVDELTATAASGDEAVIAGFDRPREGQGSIAVLGGNLAPSGALIKRSAASPSLLRHRGPAVVFDHVEQLASRIDDPALEIDEDSVLVLRNCGPRGGPGMPEWGMLPIPRRLLRRGVTDLVRISDARMSGTASGTVVLHVAPEAACGGPLAAVRDGDPIVLDVAGRSLTLDLPQREIERRLGEHVPPPPPYRRGYGRLYLEHVLQADEGCDFDFLRGGQSLEDREPPGLLNGWVGGW
ncbi:MAG TPA: dihydroxy-acid dehydratase [Solirubrobacterales bacterium]|nr:dihydroxy-acid dehydratase [Solirubrobacterales bacterium]